MKKILILILFCLVQIPLMAQEATQTQQAEQTKPAEKPKPQSTKSKQKPIKTVYVSDRLFLGVTKSPASGQRAITTLKNGTAMQLLEEQKRYSKVRLEDGKEGWVRNLFISDTLPASQQLPKLEKEKAELQKQIDILKNDLQQQVSPQELFTMTQEKLAMQKTIDESQAGRVKGIISSIVLSVVTLIIGFVLGYWVLARRVKEKFHGMRVW